MEKPNKFNADQFLEGTRLYMLTTGIYYLLYGIFTPSIDTLRSASMFALKGILRAESQEKILLYLLVRKAGYGKAIAEFFDLSTNAVHKQLARLEDDSVVVSRPIGRLREFQLNPRYAFAEPLRVLLKSALRTYPDTIVNALALPRTRPRKTGKPESYVRR